MNLASLSNDVTMFYGKQLSFPGFISSQDEEGTAALQSAKALVKPRKGIFAAIFRSSVT